MSDEYTNLDLDTADELLVASGHPEIAKALRFQTQGNRNLIQGEWGKSFVNALENIMDTRVVNVLTSVQQRLDEQIGLVERLIAMVQGANATAQEALTVSKENGRGLGKTNAQQSVHTKQIKAIVARIQALEDNNKRFDALEAEIRRLARRDDGE